MRLRRFFDGRARHYEKILSIPVIKDVEQREVAEILKIAQVKGKKVLDIGCGYGKFSKYWLEGKAGLIIGLDFSEEMIKKAKSKFNGCHFVVGDAFSVPLKDKSVDIVACIGVTNYYKDITKLLDGMKRVGREMIISYPQKSFLGRVYIIISKVGIFLRSREEIEKISSEYLESSALKECGLGLTLVTSGKFKE